MTIEREVAKAEYPIGYLDQLVTEKEAARFLGYSVRALQNWRLRGGGPQYVKVSSRSVRYRRRDLHKWTDERIRRNTSEADPVGTRRLNLDS